MSVEAWRARIAAIAANLQTDVMRAELLEHRLESGLVQLWLAMQTPPAAVRSAYEVLRERDLASAATRAAQLALKAYPEWTPDFDAPLKDFVREVATEIRALDKALYECRNIDRWGDPNDDYCAFGDHPAFIVPCVEGSRPTGRRGQDFDRRGLFYHRILPANIDDLVVRLYRPALQGPGMDGAAADLISALFAKVLPTVASDKAKESFRITGLANEAELAGEVRAHIAALDDGPGAMAVVWPELTISPALQSLIADGLAQRTLADEVKPVGFVVAGSWHETRQGGFANIAPVLNGFGVPILEVLKRGRYEIEPGNLEGIDPGKELPILMYGRVLIGFGICKDFCERRFETPLTRLDVDLIIVPSLGNSNTMDQHAAAADTIASRYGARALVVQQFLPDAQSAVWGSVLRPATVPRGKRLDPVRQEKSLDRTRISCTIA